MLKIKMKSLVFLSVIVFLSITIFCNFGYCDTPESPEEPQIPEPIESCPELNSSMYGTKIQVLGREALVWVGQKQENKKRDLIESIRTGGANTT